MFTILASCHASILRAKKLIFKWTKNHTLNFNTTVLPVLQYFTFFKT